MEKQKTKKKATKIGLIFLALYLVPAGALVLGRFANSTLPASPPAVLEQYHERIRESLQKNSDDVDYFESNGRSTVRRFAS